VSELEAADEQAMLALVGVAEGDWRHWPNLHGDLVPVNHVVTRDYSPWAMLAQLKSDRLVEPYN
jgi:hypothetical protein